MKKKLPFPEQLAARLTKQGFHVDKTGLDAALFLANKGHLQGVSDREIRASTNLSDSVNSNGKSYGQWRFSDSRMLHFVGPAHMGLIGSSKLQQQFIVPSPGKKFLLIGFPTFEVQMLLYLLKSGTNFVGNYFGEEDFYSKRSRQTGMPRDEVKRETLQSLYGRAGTRPLNLLFPGVSAFVRSLAEKKVLRTPWGTPIQKQETDLVSTDGSKFPLTFVRMIRTSCADRLFRSIKKVADRETILAYLPDGALFEIDKLGKIGHIIDAFSDPASNMPPMVPKFGFGSNLFRAVRNTWHNGSQT